LPDLALDFNSATIVSPIRHGLRLHVLKLERIEHAGVSDAHTSVHRVGPVIGIEKEQQRSERPGGMMAWAANRSLQTR